jgi:hypothetical protein
MRTDAGGVLRVADYGLRVARRALRGMGIGHSAWGIEHSVKKKQVYRVVSCELGIPSSVFCHLTSAF